MRVNRYCVVVVSATRDCSEPLALLDEETWHVDLAPLLRCEQDLLIDVESASSGVDAGGMVRDAGRA